jgi:hypothetical protein
MQSLHKQKVRPYIKTNYKCIKTLFKNINIIILPNMVNFGILKVTIAKKVPMANRT